MAKLLDGKAKSGFFQVTARQLDMWTAEAQEERQMKELPLRVLINPVITPVDNTQVAKTGCQGQT